MPIMAQTAIRTSADGLISGEQIYDVRRLYRSVLSQHPPAALICP